MSELIALNIAPEVEFDEQSVAVPGQEEDDYDRFLADLWVGVVLTLMVLSCVGCLCTCFLYHSFKQWQRRVLEARRVEGNEEAGYDTESLPSYTVAAGLPSYEEAIEQLKQGALKQSAAAQQTEASQSETDGNVAVFSRLSVGDLLEIYKSDIKK